MVEMNVFVKTRLFMSSKSRYVIMDYRHKYESVRSAIRMRMDSINGVDFPSLKVIPEMQIIVVGRPFGQTLAGQDHMSHGGQDHAPHVSHDAVWRGRTDEPV
jgi:hypothetical protein